MKWILIITLFATIFRFYIFLDFASGCCGSDEGMYHNMAVNFVKSGEFFVTQSDEPRLWNDIVYGAKPPLYPLFLASVYKFLGPNYHAARVAQIFISALTGLLIYFITKELTSKKIGIAALLIYSFFFEAAFISVILLSESLYWFLLSLLIYLLIMIKKYNKRLEIIAGIVLGLLILTRPPSILFLVLILFWFLWRKIQILSLAKVAIIAVFCFITVTPWTLRNFRIYHQFIFVYTDGGINMWMGNHQGTGGTYRVPKSNDPTQTPLLTSIGIEKELERDRFYYNQAFSYILNNKLQVFDLSWKKLFGIFKINRQAVINYTQFESEILPMRLRPTSFAIDSFLEFIVSYQFAALIIFSFLGWLYFIMRKNFNTTFVLLTGLVFIHLSSIILTHYEFRYIEQIYPLIIPFAALLLTRVWQIFNKRTF